MAWNFFHARPSARFASAAAAPSPLGDLPADLQGSASQCRRAPAQIVGCIRRVLENSKYIERLQGRAYSATDRLRSVGQEACRRQSEARRDSADPFRKVTRRRLAADLGGGTDRNIDHDVRRAGGNLLRQNRRDELPFGIDIELALYADENVVSRAQMHRPTPGDAATFGFDHASERRRCRGRPERASPSHPRCLPAR